MRGVAVARAARGVVVWGAAKALEVARASLVMAFVAVTDFAWPGASALPLCRAPTDLRRRSSAGRAAVLASWVESSLSSL